MRTKDLQTTCDPGQLTTAQLKKLCILQLAEMIVSEARGSKFSEEYFSSNKPLLVAMARRLHLTVVQVTLLSACLELCGSCTMEALADFFDCSNLRFLSFYKELMELCQKHYLVKMHIPAEKDLFRIRPEALMALAENKPYEPEERRERRMSRPGRSRHMDQKCVSVYVGKELFYNEREGRQMAELAAMLEQDAFLAIQSRMEECGMRKGFACLLFGAPGTGKTESVYQLARATGREVMEVNVDEIRSKWVGESEENIRAVFRDYRHRVETQEVAPILLFNEADAILGKRRQGDLSASDRMENSVQNIILQEMETLEGVMIATTNLIDNLDKAFERRFIYKVKFDTPSAEVKAKIWHSMLPELEEAQCKELATGFQLSGGQIENVKRRKQVTEVLTGRAIPFDTLKEYCAGEVMNQPHRAIGFVA